MCSQGGTCMSSRRLKAGDIVYCQRSNFFSADTYQHYGVYIGYKRIIHYVKGNHILDGIIAETSIDEFCKGDTLYIAEEDTLLSIFQESELVATFFGPRKTVLRAKELIGTKEYDLLENNCEHFAIWCKTGLKKSTQVSFEGILVKLIRPSCGPLKWFVDEFWRIKAEY